MAVPRNRNSNAHKNTKRAHHAKVKKNFASCPECGIQKMPHVVCPSCGTYRKRKVVETSTSA